MSRLLFFAGMHPQPGRALRSCPFCLRAEISAKVRVTRPFANDRKRTKMLHVLCSWRIVYPQVKYRRLHFGDRRVKGNVTIMRIQIIHLFIS